MEEIDHVLKLHFLNENILALRELLVNSLIYHGIGFQKINEELEETFIPTEIISTIQNNQLTFEESIEFVNEWLKSAFTKKNNDEEIDKIFKIIGALILQRLGFILNGKSMTEHLLFSHLKGSVLDNYTLPKKLSIIYNEQYWKYFTIFEELGLFRDRLISHEYRDVCVVGEVDVKSVAIPLISSEKVLEINMESQFIGNNTTNRLMNDEFTENPSIRMVFDYTESTSSIVH